MYGFEIYPNLSDEVTPGDVSFNSMSYNMIPCKLCGAMIIKSGKEAHVTFHNELLTIKDM